MRWSAWWLVALVTRGCNAAPSAAPPSAATVAAVPPARASGFLKGQLHAHTSASGDSDTPATAAAAWYASRGFDFVVFTDHNHVTDVAAPPGMLVFRGVEITQNLRTCIPPPRRGDACLLHINALFVSPSATWTSFGAPESRARTDIYGRAVDRALAMGGLAQLNHPNFQGGADLEVLLAVAKRGATLVEIANEAVDSANDASPGRASTEELWDAALVRGVHVFATATDDAHHYEDAPFVRARGGTAYTGDRGFVMVRADRNEQAIRAALVAGDFYASTGVVLDRLELSPRALVVEPRLDTLPPFTFEVISGGQVVARETGTRFSFDPSRLAPGYVRVRVTDSGGRHAWTQPLWR